MTLVVATLAIVNCDDFLTSGRFARSHIVLQGVVRSASTAAPVSGTMLSISIQSGDCTGSPGGSSFWATAAGDGTFGLRLDTLEVGSGLGCIRIRAIPPESLGLGERSVTLDNVNMVRTTTPPDTVRVTILLDAVTQ